MNNQILLKIAHDTIASRFDNTFKIDKEKLKKEYEFLNKKTATFVTLKIDEELRGCVGTLEASHSLLDDLMVNTNNAAFHDSRFYELSYDEFLKTDIEISILEEPKLLEYKNKEDLKAKVKPNTHGVILTQGLKKATFLPQVWEELPSFEEFFFYLCQKANLEDDSFSSHPSIYIYKVRKIK